MAGKPAGGKRVRVGAPKTSAAGVPGITHSLEYALEEMGPGRSLRTLLKLNQDHGFDCPSCAWPDPDPAHRKTAEFCENGAKAVAWEATRKRVGPEFFADHSVAELREADDHWLESNGRLTEPMYLAPGAAHYAPISWGDALQLTADRLRALDDPNQAVFYTSGRASNEAAFAYQLLARRLGTNNLPDCSNMCHESSGAALAATVGIGKGVVTLSDIEDHADLILIAGQNPGTNHPRMLTALEKAKRRGARIIAINPLPEAGFSRFRNPQTPRGLAGPGTTLADKLLPVRLNGDLALFAGLNRALLEREDARPGQVFDRDFIDTYCDGFGEAVASWRALDWAVVEQYSGLSRAQIEDCAADVVAATKLNRSHLHHGTEALLLPCLGRTERDVQAAGEQFVTVEDSMSMVHASRGRLIPASDQLRSEIAIITGLGHVLFGDDIGWCEMGSDYRTIRKHIEHVVPGFQAYEERVVQPGGFMLPRGPHDSRTFPTVTGKARFTVNPLHAVQVPDGHMLLQTIRSHDQFNTTVYGLDDRYRGIKGGRRVIFVNAGDLREQGLSDGAMVDIVSVWTDGERRAKAFRAVAYPTPRGCTAAYFPEANVLVPLDSTAEMSNTPTSKSIIVRLEPAS